MNTRVWILYFLAAYFLLTSCDPSGEDRFAAFVAAVQAEMRELNVPGAAFALIENQEIVFSRGFGTRDPAKERPVDAHTLFRIGSCTKAMTAVALLQQVAEGNVALNQSVGSYLPGFYLTSDPDAASTITLKQLLTHSHGIVDYLEIDAEDSYQNDEGLAAFLTGRFADVGYLMVPPGTFYNYSNPGYMLVGLVAEQEEGHSYRTLMRDRVFAPLHMSRTFFLANEVLADGNYAVGKATRPWGPNVPSVLQPDSYDNPWARPAGYAWSSVEDLAHFVIFLMNGDPMVLEPSLWKAMQSAQVNTEEIPDLAGYGYGLGVLRGFFLNGFRALQVIEHAGAIPGFAAEFFYLPELRFGFVSLASSDGAYFPKSLTTALSSLPDLPAPTTPPDLTVDPADFPDYTGVYVDPHLVGRIEVSTDGQQLLVSMPDLEAAGIPYERELAPVFPRNFLLTIQEQALAVTFLLGPSGRYDFIRSRPAVGVRQGPVAVGVSRLASIRVDPQRLERALRTAALEPSPQVGFPGRPAL